MKKLMIEIEIILIEIMKEKEFPVNPTQNVMFASSEIFWPKGRYLYKEFISGTFVPLTIVGLPWFGLGPS